MRAVGQYIAIKTINEEAKIGSFVMSLEDKNNARIKRGIIESCGVEVVEELKKGSVVYYDVANSFDMVVENEVFTIIRQRDIIAVSE